MVKLPAFLLINEVVGASVGRLSNPCEPYDGRPEATSLALVLSNLDQTILEVQMVMSLVYRKGETSCERVQDLIPITRRLSFHSEIRRFARSSSFARRQVQRLSAKLRREDAFLKETFAFAHRNILRRETHTKVAVSTIGILALCSIPCGLISDL